MQANRFYSIPFDGHNWADFKMLVRLEGDPPPMTYGRLHILLGTLYQQGGRFEYSELWQHLLADELAMDHKHVPEFLEHCAAVDIISAEMLGRGVVTSQGVCNELARRAEETATRKERSRKGNEAKRKKAAEKAAQE